MNPCCLSSDILEERRFFCVELISSCFCVVQMIFFQVYPCSSVCSFIVFCVFLHSFSPVFHAMNVDLRLIDAVIFMFTQAFV